ncbi:hypothetical protein J3Q64DRAFT_1702600 [Phycomyces blakesleeanus]|uniref:Uncharacterized protein n=2 Tax=Phycomyces blakesleeanus TaxID=4837 RepID=A0A167LW12_PHYB8|nr:hypothetical protein PHYBLDRAFT_170584 [Phycomyces blakesleeanus NRRL 1555(-)]OAD71206.1 hypothetical protein PHYBLDRAFT_170584 [Phycomyces blakesleeanus NRRL 1555(-)]|eukprot:XP_018289246.1 hypothetical protein PHYBLDRAFT_170584 [Phycomyces blakesleeanus NRRL 1555(-)]
MFSQTSSKSNSTSCVPNKRQRSFSQESIDVPTSRLKTSNDSSMDINSGDCSLQDSEISFCDLDEKDEEEHGIQLDLDPSQLDEESQLVYKICNVSNFKFWFSRSSN